MAATTSDLTHETVLDLDVAKLEEGLHGVARKLSHDASPEPGDFNAGRLRHYRRGVARELRRHNRRQIREIKLRQAEQAMKQLGPVPVLEPATTLSRRGRPCLIPTTTQQHEPDTYLRRDHPTVEALLAQRLTKSERRDAMCVPMNFAADGSSRLLTARGFVEAKGDRS